jgi:RNA polymerase sigma-70 factor (ECF subfamily)
MLKVLTGFRTHSTMQNMKSMDDRELLRRIARRDEEALVQLYDRYAHILYGVAYRVVRRKDNAEDILQEVFLQVWNRAETYNPVIGIPSVWLIKIARNRAIDYRRSREFQDRQRDVEFGETLGLADPSPDPMRLVQTTQASALMRKALDRLPVDQRQLIELAYYEGYTQSELSKKLSMPLGTVKTRMRTGLFALRDYFQSTKELLSHSE